MLFCLNYCYDMIKFLEYPTLSALFTIEFEKVMQNINRCLCSCLLSCSLGKLKQILVNNCLSVTLLYFAYCPDFHLCVFTFVLACLENVYFIFILKQTILENPLIILFSQALFETNRARDSIQNL